MGARTNGSGLARPKPAVGLHLLGAHFVNRLSKARRQKMMAGFRGKGNHSTEQAFRLAMVRAGVSGWNLHEQAILGKPDFWFPRAKVAVFVDGCFWHGCLYCCRVPVRNSGYWAKKIKSNQERDRKITRRLRRTGIVVLRFWEHELVAKRISVCLRRLVSILQSK